MANESKKLHKKKLRSMYSWKTKIAFIFFVALVFTACDYDMDKISGHAVIVDNFNEKNPLENIYIEIEYTKDGGYSFNFLQDVKTDKNGYFKIETEFNAGFLCMDCRAIANVYSNEEYLDTLGSFNFQFAHNTYAYKTIHLDTFALSHNVFIVPKIIDLGDYHPDEILIYFYNCELADDSQKNVTYKGPISINQTFAPIEMIMSLNMQHWLSYGTKHLARGSLRKDSQEVGFGYFKLETSKRTMEGDTIYINFHATKTE